MGIGKEGQLQMHLELFIINFKREYGMIMAHDQKSKFFIFCLWYSCKSFLFLFFLKIAFFLIKIAANLAV